MMWSNIQERCPEWLQGNEIYGGLRGSDAHNTKIEGHVNSTDDTDVFVITCQTPYWYLMMEGYYNKRRQVFETAGEDLDILVYDFRKFIHLISKGNPNVLFFLALEPEKVLYKTRAVDILRDSRDVFLTMRVFDALLGYAFAQFKKMEKDSFYGYMGEKRKGIVNEYGFDLKNASHCYRLLQTGRYLHETGNILVELPKEETERAKDIKKGLVPLDEIKEEMQQIDADLRNTVYENPRFPDKVDEDVVNGLVISVINKSHEERMEMLYA